MILVTGRNLTDDVIYNVSEFNYKENTQKYLLSCISLAECLIFLQILLLLIQAMKKQMLYLITFQYKKWQTMPESIVLKGTNTNTFYTLF